MNVRIDESWRKRLQEEFDKPYFEQLVTFVKNEYKQAHVLPPGPQIFHIFNACPFEKVKVVILGQDPYPNPGQYYGVCFSVPDGVAIPGSLMNIFKEIYDDLEKPIPSSWNLDRWVSQGVFPMNSVKISLIDTSRHLVLTTVHPSPRSAEYGFFGCKHFSKANDFLRGKGIPEIDW